MQITLDQPELSGAEASDELFGGNVLATRSSMTGDGSYAEAIEDLGVTNLRYPGGSLTEYYFDLEDPDAETAVHSETGEESDFIPLSDFMEYAEEAGQDVTIVIPTRDQLSDETDENGDRITAIEEDILRDFVDDVMTGTYGDATVTAFEIGNEYWGSGEMNAVEYGRLAAEMSVIINDELESISEVYGIDTSETQIIIQSGTNYGTSKLSEEYDGWSAEDVIDDLNEKYPDADISSDDIRSNGSVNWSTINNELLQMSFNTPEEQDAIDGIVTHVYSGGAEEELTRYYDLEHIEADWLQDEGFEDLEIYVTEWNQKTTTSSLDNTEDYGLYQAHEMLNLVETFMEYDVDEAYVWPLIQNTTNTLSGGMEYSGKTVAAEMFTMMSENIPGKTMLDFATGEDHTTEEESQDVDVHGFAGDDDLVFYIASVSDETTTTELDISGLVESYGAMEIQILGVAEGESPGYTRSETEIETLNPDDIYEDGVLSITLDTGEIMQVVISDVEATDAFAETMAIANGEVEDIADDEDQDSTDDEMSDENGEEGEDQDGDDDGDDDDSGSGLSGLGDVAWLLALLPVLALASLV